MSKNEKLWERVKQRISDETTLTQDELTHLDRKIITSTIDQDDWKNLVLNSLEEPEKIRKDGDENDRKQIEKALYHIFTGCKTAAGHTL